MWTILVLCLLSIAVPSTIGAGPFGAGAGGLGGTACIGGSTGGSTGGGGCRLTSPAEEGPYYKPNAPRRNSVICEWEKYDKHIQLMVHGRVLSSDCRTGLPAVLDVWSANPSGDYSPKEGPDFECRGKLNTDAEGNYKFLTVIPGRYSENGSLRPVHIHYKVNKVNDDKILTMQQYFTDDPFFQGDPCGPTCKSGEPTLTVPLILANGTVAQSFMSKFDIVLQ